MSKKVQNTLRSLSEELPLQGISWLEEEDDAQTTEETHDDSEE